MTTLTRWSLPLLLIAALTPAYAQRDLAGEVEIRQTLERLNTLDGTYTGATTLTTPNGDTLRTTSTGLFTPPDENGLTFYVEHHETVEGTGRFAGATGEFDISGTADRTTFELTAVGVGTLLF